MKTYLKNQARRAVRAVVLPSARLAMRNMVLKRFARMLLHRLPGLRRGFDAMVGRAQPLPPRRMHVPLDSADLSPAAKACYDELKRHFETRNR